MHSSNRGRSITLALVLLGVCVLTVGVAGIGAPLPAVSGVALPSKAVLVSIPMPRCAEASLWVPAHQQEAPTSLEALRAQPLTFRRTIFSVLSAANKAQIFRDQIEEFLATDGLLLAEPARDTLKEIQSLATEGTYRDRSAEVKLKLLELSTRFRAMAPGQTWVISQVGRPEGPKGIAPKIAPTDLPTEMSPNRGPSISTPSPVRRDGCDCSCNMIDAWCGEDLWCVSFGQRGCDVALSGCGTLWVYECNGLCQPGWCWFFDCGCLDWNQ